MIEKPIVEGQIFMKKNEDLKRRLQLVKLAKNKIKFQQIVDQIRKKENQKFSVNQYETKYGVLTEDEQFRVKVGRKFDRVSSSNPHLLQKAVSTLDHQAGQTSFHKRVKRLSLDKQIEKLTELNKHDEVQELKTIDKIERNPSHQANSMINYCFQQLQNLEETNNKEATGCNGKQNYLDSLSKGRILVRFMNHRANPAQNRYYQTEIVQEKLRQQREFEEAQKLKQMQLKSQLAFHLSKKLTQKQIQETNSEEQSIQALSPLPRNDNKEAKDFDIQIFTKHQSANEFANLKIELKDEQQFQNKKSVEGESNNFRSEITTTQRIEPREVGILKQKNSSGSIDAQPILNTNFINMTANLRAKLNKTPALTQIRSRLLTSHNQKMRCSTPVPLFQSEIQSKPKLRKGPSDCSIMQIFQQSTGEVLNESQQQSLTYQTIKPCELSIQGGNYTLPLHPKGFNPSSQAQQIARDIIQKSTSLMNNSQREKFIEQKYNTQLNTYSKTSRRNSSTGDVTHYYNQSSTIQNSYLDGNSFTVQQLRGLDRREDADSIAERKLQNIETKMNESIKCQNQEKFTKMNIKEYSRVMKHIIVRQKSRTRSSCKNQDERIFGNKDCNCTRQ